jgi:hypothetical protein
MVMMARESACAKAVIGTFMRRGALAIDSAERLARCVSQ